MEGEALVLTIGPARQAYRLRHWTGDRFAFDLQGENAAEGSRSEVSFDLGASPAAMTVEYWDQNGLGSFTR